MKRSHLIIIVLLSLSAAAAAQDRPRYFDNFDTSRGVNVYKPAPVVIASSNKKNKRLVKKTAQVTARTQPTRMNVSDGFAEREMAQTRQERLRTQMTTGGSSLKGFTTGDMTIDSYIVDSSRRYGIDPLLIYSQMHQESTFKAHATSNKGASGLMQLMPGTARRMGVTNIYDPKQNIEGGVKYMRLLLDMFGGDVNLALAGYNAGEGAVMKYGNQIPPYSETQEYVRRISERYNSITDPSYIRSARRVNAQTAKQLAAREGRPLAVYEPSPIAIRLADGRMRLVNQ